jgi:2-hydroxychromene-2-carboxylate isomerase
MGGEDEMSSRVEFHFDFGSPNAYLSHRVIPEIERRTNVRFEYVPVLLGGVFKATGNLSPAESLRGIANKPQYQALEIRRFIEQNKIDDFRPNPHFPVNTLQIMRGALVAKREQCFERYVDEVFRHMWSAPKKMDDLEVIRAALLESKLPADAILEGTRDPDIKAQLLTNTEDSVARGVFGSPSFFVGDELFFGKDRLSEVEHEIEGQRSR